MSAVPVTIGFYHMRRDWITAAYVALTWVRRKHGIAAGAMARATWRYRAESRPGRPSCPKARGNAGSSKIEASTVAVHQPSN